MSDGVLVPRSVYAVLLQMVRERTLAVGPSDNGRPGQYLPKRATVNGGIGAASVGSVTLVGLDTTVQVYNPGGVLNDDDQVVLFWSPGSEVSEDNEDDPVEEGQWEVIPAGGGECECECVHELSTAGSPSGGSIGLTYTIDGVAGSLVTVDHDDSATTIRDAIVAANSSKLNNDNLKVYGGPLPMVAVYIRFTDDLTGEFIPVPSVSNSLTGSNVSPKYGIFTAPGWS